MFLLVPIRMNAKVKRKISKQIHFPPYLSKDMDVTKLDQLCLESGQVCG